ncbi:cyclic nucleotide-binding domain-containing protein [Streptomyces sp. NPDC127098]|uniref:cyclic nucleotide-binding domain-containing protein n=1 Tax=Streptomyces sp. NPDC127098 TaxID=3347137 RepID=UPI00364BF12A
MTTTTGFLAGLTPPHRGELLALGGTVSFPADSRLFEEGQPADRFWLLTSGSVALDIHVSGRPAPIIETLGPGDLLGWSWLFPPYRWHLGARALSPVACDEFEVRAVRARCDADPAFGYDLARAVAAVVGQRLKATRMRLLDVYGPPREEAR